MEPTSINATDLRVRHREIMERVKYYGESFLVKTFGQPMAVIISVDEYQRISGEALGSNDGRPIARQGRVPTHAEPQLGNQNRGIVTGHDQETLSSGQSRAS